jgi:hypothetical protein
MPDETFRPGEAVRLVSTADPATRLRHGEMGTVLHTDDAGTVHVRWEGGSTLGLIPGMDEWERVTLCTRCGQPLAPGCCPTVADPAWWTVSEDGR